MRAVLTNNGHKHASPHPSHEKEKNNSNNNRSNNNSKNEMKRKRYKVQMEQKSQNKSTKILNRTLASISPRQRFLLLFLLSRIDIPFPPTSCTLVVVAPTLSISSFLVHSRTCTLSLAHILWMASALLNSLFLFFFSFFLSFNLTQSHSLCDAPRAILTNSPQRSVLSQKLDVVCREDAHLPRGKDTLPPAGVLLLHAKNDQLHPALKRELVVALCSVCKPGSCTSDAREPKRSKGTGKGVEG